MPHPFSETEPDVSAGKPAARYAYDDPVALAWAGDMLRVAMERRNARLAREAAEAEAGDLAA